MSTRHFLQSTTCRALVAALLTAGAALAAAAEPYPDRPIQLVVPFAAGGGLDQNARAFGQALAEVLKTTVVVTNRDGAAGTIGMQYVAGARPDGYTLAFTPAVPLTSEPHRLKTLAYKLASFEPVCHVFDNIFAIAVPAASPIKDMRDLLERARAKADALSYGTSGTGSIPHLGTADIEAATGVKLVHVPYKGDGPMFQDLLGGRLDFGAMLASSVTGHVQSGSLRLIAVYADRRHPAFPNVPTLRESGVDVVQLSFGGLLAPAATPRPVLDTLQSACERAAKSPVYLEWAQKAGQVVDYRPAAAFDERLKQDSQAKAAVIQRLGL